MEFGISTACCYPAYLEDTIEQFGKNGVSLLEIFFNTTSEIEPRYLKELIARIQFYGMSVPSIHPFTSGFESFWFFTPYERRFLDGISYYRPYFEAAQKVGAKYLVFHGNNKHSNFPTEQYFERFAKLREVGKEYGVLLAQENVAPYHSNHPLFLKQLREYLKDDVDFVLDVKQAVRAGHTVGAVMDAMGDCISHLHLSDHNHQDDCMAIGAGSFDFVQFLNQIQQVKTPQTAVIELYRHSYETYQQLYDGLFLLQRAWQQAMDVNKTKD